MALENILGFLTGIALLLFGMDMMGKNLEKISGGKLEHFLEKMTSNKIMGILLGLSVTAVIQSSAATTVMAIGFVNSGIMKLSQAIGVIMGANIGTTVTAWILSLSGLDGDSLIVNILKPSSFAPVFSVIGVVLVMFFKREKIKSIGGVILGFGVLMLGMATMSTAVAPLSESREFADILVKFSNPLFGILAGAVVTAVLQSSSASVGILQALASTGAVNFGTAFPIIMGQNIGTCVTALLSSIGANKNARRTALIHLLFNVIGTAIFTGLYYALNAIFKFSFADAEVNEVNIAIVHTVFNVSCTLLFLPFTKVLEWLVCHIVKDTPSKTDEIEILDDRFLNSPAFALEQCKNATVRMAQIAKENLALSISIINKYDKKIAAEVEENEELADKYEDRLGTYLMKISDKDLSVSESKDVTKLMHCIGDFERMSDHSVNLKECAEEIHEKGITFSPDAQREISAMEAALSEILELTYTVFINNDPAAAANIEPLEEVVDYLREQFRLNHIERTRQGKCTIETGFVYSDFLTNVERVADHCSNVALCVIELQGDTYDVHEYSRTLKERNPAGFVSLYESYKKKFVDMLTV